MGLFFRVCVVVILNEVKDPVREGTHVMDGIFSGAYKKSDIESEGEAPSEQPTANKRGYFRKKQDAIRLILSVRPQTDVSKDGIGDTPRVPFDTIRCGESLRVHGLDLRRAPCT